MYNVTESELIALAGEIKNWSNLAPYEKENILWQVKDLAIQHKHILGPRLTEQVLYATLVLTNSLDASRIAFPPSTGPLEPSS